MFVGVGFLLAARLRPFRRSLWLDGLVSGLTLAAFAAAFVFNPLLSSTEGDPVTVAVTLGYPVADLLLVSVVGLSFALTGWRPDRTWSLIAASFVLTAIADAVFAYTASSDTYIAGQITDTLWSAGALAMATAAWQASRAAHPAGGREAIAIVVPATLALAALGLLICGWFANLLPAAGIVATLALLAAVARGGLLFVENLALLRASRDEALTDALTGLGNRRLLIRALDESFTARPRPLTLVFFDLDGFKSYNDAFGHVAGDALLVRLAHNLDRAAAAAASPTAGRRRVLCAPGPAGGGGRPRDQHRGRGAGRTWRRVRHHRVLRRRAASPRGRQRRAGRAAGGRAHVRQQGVTARHGQEPGLQRARPGPHGARARAARAPA